MKRARTSRVTWWVSVAALSATLLSTQAHADSVISSLEYLSNTTFATGTRYNGELIAGLSGIDYSASTGQFVSQRDNVIAGSSPIAFYLQPVFNSSGTSYTVAMAGTNNLGGAQLNGLESIRYDRSGNGVWLASESPNSIYHVDANGSTKQLVLPANVTTATGNYGLEGLTFTPSGDVWVSRENALPGDRTDIIRLSQIAEDGALVRQVAYTLDNVQASSGSTIANPPGAGVGNNGVSEILAISDTTFLVMERGWDGVGANVNPTGASHNNVRIYYVDISGASDVSGIEHLTDSSGIAHATKTLVFDSTSLASVLNTYDTKVDNLEGMSFGPALADGRTSLVLVSDNNNSNSQRKTQFIAFAVNTVSAIPEPSTWALLLVGFGIAIGTVRFRRPA